MKKKILTTLALTPLALILSGFLLAQLENQDIDPVSLATGCGVTALGNECLYQCLVERHHCLPACAPMPDDCPSGPECQEYEACRTACYTDWQDCVSQCWRR